MRETTMERIVDAIRELDYTPVKAAQNLRRQKTGVIALLLPDISNPFFSLLARGVEAAGFEVGYSTLICDSNDSLEQESQHMGILLRENVDGLILVPVGRPDRANLERLARANVEIVTADRRVPEIPYVEADNTSGSLDLARYLLGLGYRKLAYVGGPREVSTAEDRLQGFVTGLSEAGVAPVTVCRGGFTYDFGFSLGTQVLREQCVDVIVAGNDLMAIGVVHAAAAMGKRVPEDLGVAGFDGIQWASLVRPKLTTVCVPFFEMGQCAARALIDRILLRDGAADRNRLPVRLVIGDSTCVQT